MDVKLNVPQRPAQLYPDYNYRQEPPVEPVEETENQNDDYNMNGAVPAGDGENKSHWQKRIEVTQEHVEALVRLTDQIIKAAKKNTVKEESLQYKKSIVENMLKTLRVLKQSNYTKDSYKKCMRDVEKAVALYKSRDLSQAKLNRAVNYLRAGMHKLKSAKMEDEKGKYKDAMKAYAKEDTDIKKKLKELGFDVENISFSMAEAPAAEYESTADYSV